MSDAMEENVGDDINDAPYTDAELADLARKNRQTKDGPPAPDHTIRRENRRLSRWLATVSALRTRAALQGGDGVRLTYRSTSA